MPRHPQSAVAFYAARANPYLADLDAYQPGPTASAAASRYGLDASRVLKLSSNEAPLGPAPLVREAICALAESDELHRYPSSGMEELREAVSASLGLAPENILLGAGSSDTWPMIVRAFSRPGDEVLTTAPSMASYAEVATLSERKPRVVTVGPPFDVTASHVLAQVSDRTRIIFLSSPNNTTSRLVSLDAVREIAMHSDSVVVVDEHYIEAADLPQDTTAIRLIEEFPNVIVTRTFSKLYGLAGVRVGYAVGPRPAVDILSKYKGKWNVSVLAEHSAKAALAATDHLAANQLEVRRGRNQVVDALGSHGEHFEIAPAPQGNFVLFRPTTASAQDIFESLASQGVIVRGDLWPDWLRVSIGTSAQNARFLEAVTVALDQQNLASRQ